MHPKMYSEKFSMHIDAGHVESVAQLIGITPSAVRLLLTVLAGYPLAAVHRILVRRLRPTLQHVFFATCGLLLYIFNFGFDCYHSIIAIWTTYLLASLLYRKPKLLIATNSIFHMSYLLVGYWYREDVEYDISWTLPHCVLVLRLIGLGFDVVDGQKPNSQLTNDQKETALIEVPSFIEIAGYTFFPASFMVGPQFPFSRYQRFIQGEFQGHSGSIKAGLKRAALGIAYATFRVLGTAAMPEGYLLTDGFRNQTMLMKLVCLGLWGKIVLSKYITCWLFAEGALMCTGFTYVGKTYDGRDNWSGCTTVKLGLLETGTRMYQHVHSFNVNTNMWVSQHIYKRLKFLNNRTISYAGALSFLAMWHGLHSGYYMTFFMEYYTNTMEKQLEVLYNKMVLPKYGHILTTSRVYVVVTFVLLRLYNIIYMGWCLVPFVLLSYDRWLPVFESLNFIGFIVFGMWALLHIHEFGSTLWAAKGQRGQAVEIRISHSK